MKDAKGWFWLLLDIFLGILVVSSVLFGMPALVQFNNSLFASRTITVSAEGKTTATPDIAETSFSVVTQGQNPATLSTNNADKMNAVLQFVSSQGIAQADVKTTAYDLQPNYQWDKNTQRNFIDGYTLTQTVDIKIRDLNKVADILGGLAPLGVNQIGGVNFTIDNDEPVIALARADAFAKAEAKALSMARAAGVSLGQVINVQENSAVPFPYYADKAVYGMGAGVPSAAPSIQPGTQDITDNVTITYSLH
jgi:uncharacterized protein